jgi:predicted Zn-dependent protease
MPDANELFEKGCRAIKWNRYRQAERHLTQALALAPDWHDALQRRALSREGLGRLPEAASDYRHALRTDPSCDWCLESLAGVYTRMNRPNDSIKCLSRAVLLNPREPSYRHDLGQAYLKVGNYRAAILQFQRIRKSKRFRLLWRQGRGQAFALLGKTARALEDLDACVMLRPDSDEAWFYRGLAKRICLAPPSLGA